MAEAEATMRITEAGPEKFALTVVYDGQEFDCGVYLNRGAASQAGKLFIERKKGEESSRKKRPRKK